MCEQKKTPRQLIRSALLEAWIAGKAISDPLARNAEFELIGDELYVAIRAAQAAS